MDGASISKLQGSRRAKMTHDPKKNHYNWKIHFCYFLSHEIHIDALLCPAQPCITPHNFALTPPLPPPPQKILAPPCLIDKRLPPIPTLDDETVEGIWHPHLQHAWHCIGTFAQFSFQAPASYFTFTYSTNTNKNLCRNFLSIYDYLDESLQVRL